MPVHDAGVPAALKPLPRWVCWSWTWTGKKWDKPPKQADGRQAATDNPATWTDYQTALAAHRAGRCDGIGFVLGKDHESGITYSGVDLDGHRDKATGTPSAFARDVLHRLRTYVEVSPSGEGFKAITTGALPRGRRAEHAIGVEMYDGGRYFTITGRRVPKLPAEVMDRPRELAELHAELLGDRSPRGAGRLSDPEMALSGLAGLSPTRAEGYRDWLTVGMALHSVSEDLLPAWDAWSRACPGKYKEGECCEKWKTFKRGGGLTVASLIRWAQADGWTRPRDTAAAGHAHEGNGQADTHLDQAHEDSAGQEEGRPEPVLLTMSEVEVKPVVWLWECRIPRGAVTLLDGDPDLGKSTITLDLAARVSKGWLMPPAPGPVEGAEPEGVLLLNAEDDPERTIKPRLMAAGAEVSRVHQLEAVRIAGEEQPPVLPWDLELVERVILEKEVALVVVDPFMAYLDGKIDSHKDQEIRRCLHRLKQLAQKTRAAVVIVRHLNKLNGPPALYRGGGSIGIIGAARSALVVGRDPDNPERRVLASNKCNLGPPPRSLTYTLEAAGRVAVVAWGEETDLTANEILCHGPAKRKQTVTQQCADAIRGILGAGVMDSEELDRHCKELGYSGRAIKDGRRAAGVKASRVGYGDQGKWVLSLSLAGEASGDGAPS
jgi:hypothetical protein